MVLIPRVREYKEIVMLINLNLFISLMKALLLRLASLFRYESKRILIDPDKLECLYIEFCKEWIHVSNK